MQIYQGGLFIVANLLVEVQASSESFVSAISNDESVHYNTEAIIGPTSKLNLNWSEAAHNSNHVAPAILSRPDVQAQCSAT